MFQYAKLQIGCLLVVLYIVISYYRECSRTKDQYKQSIFDLIIIVTLHTLIFDAITAVAINYPDTFSMFFLDVTHMLFFLGIDAYVFSIYLYLLKITEDYPESFWGRVKLFSPFTVNVGLILYTIDDIKYIEDPLSNYSQGWAVLACYVMAAIYFFMTLFKFIERKNYIERHKRSAIYVYLLVISGTCIWQSLMPSALITSVGFTVIVLGLYINQQNPMMKELDQYHSEMVMNFSTLVEQRDDNTGGHIRRTSMYVELLARELRNRGFYRDILTNDYIKDLTQAAPMHDIGKIAVPDMILQKNGTLTETEYETMKNHAKRGGEIILNTFGRLNDKEYVDMAYQVASYHHEKWDGSGYPEGLKGDEIPLCARIMAVADVFDALSEKRCYKEAMPLERCFEIIKSGQGKAFDPTIVDVFWEMKDKIEIAYYMVSREEELL